MNYEDERIAVEKEFLTKWGLSSLASLPVYVENGVAVNAVPPYLELSVIGTGTNQMTPGDVNQPAWHNVSGYIQVDIYVALEKGTSEARKIADVVSGILRRKKFSYGASGTIKTQSPTRRSLGPRDGKHWEAVRVAFQRHVLI